ncbi:MAG: HAMP domain-containing sensor histidine kinase [Cyanobacteriota bacterium]|nr:HAMP domain-containing sensor histidine kinase [Cyanobacteriota bacterium]
MLPKISLQTRLLLSHLAVMGVGVGALIVVGRVTSPRFFVTHLEQLEVGGINLRLERTDLVRGFELAWTKGADWSVLIGVTTAAGLGFWVSHRISQPLQEIEEVSRRVAAGDLSFRVPPNEIMELDQLGRSFNHMAESLSHIERRRRDLIGDLSHELRTPLTVLEGYLEGCADGTIEATPELFARLGNESRRLRRLVDDLQELSKAESGYLPITLQSVSLLPLLKRTLEKLGSQIGDDGPTLRLEVPSDLALIEGDPDRIEQILINIIGNAIRYTATGSITVAACHQERWVWVSVQDTGCGIATEDLPFVFERFWRADRSRSHASGGSGIGLAITRRLVELQGGRIEVESQLGQGSTFRFCLPMA